MSSARALAILRSEVPHRLDADAYAALVRLVDDRVGAPPGDAERAAAVYRGLEPVTPDEVAECVLFALTRPLHVNIDEIVVKALAQSTASRVIRST
jgi:hypothetical protein